MCGGNCYRGKCSLFVLCRICTVCIGVRLVTVWVVNVQIYRLGTVSTSNLLTVSTSNLLTVSTSNLLTVSTSNLLTVSTSNTNCQYV
jgi:hypothetical protein